MSRSYQKTIVWGRAKASRCRRAGHNDKKETKDSRDENGDFIGTKAHWQATLQTEMDYRNTIMNIMSNAGNLYNVIDFASRTIWDKFKTFCKEKYNGDMSEEAVDEFAHMQYMKDRSK